MKTKSIFKMIISILAMCAVSMCDYDVRTNPDDPNSDDYIGPPQGTFLINGGAEATNSKDVTLNMNMSNTYEMRFGNSVDEINDSGWAAYSEESGWEIESVTDGEKTVYADFRNTFGETIRVSDTIIYDTVAPEIDTFYPADGAIDLEYTITVWVSFTEAIDEDTLEGNFTVKDGGTLVEGSMSFDPDTKKATFTPAGDLDYDTTFTATVTAEITDIAGNALAAGQVWSFTTVDQNTVQSPSISPASGQFTTSRSVTISTATSGATIRYTTDNTDPTSSGTAITGTSGTSEASLTLYDNAIVRAYAFKAGMYDSSENSETYILAPTVTSITPTSGTSNGTVSITNLAGTNFKAGPPTVRLTKTGCSDIVATGVNRVSSTQITCTFDLTSVATGAWNVMVTNTDTGSGTLANGFTVDTAYGHHEAYLKALNNSNVDYFGAAVAIDGDTAVVGAYGEDSNTTTIVNGTPLTGTNDTGTANGAVYVFVRSSGTWTHQAYLKAGNTSSGDFFGSSVAIDGDTVAVGAYDEDSTTTAIINGTLTGTNDTGTANGAVYVFTRSGSTWSHQSYLKAANNTNSDRFGSSIAISGDTIVVGSPDEDSNTTAVINGTLTGTNNTGNDNGAAYVFVRSSGNWSHQSYLKAGNGMFLDVFGSFVAISGDTIAVGAYYENSTTTAIINGTLTGTNDLGSANGAVYVFTRSGSTWSHQSYLKAANNTNGDFFGSSVAISSDTIIVGSINEGSTTTAIVNGTLTGTNDLGSANGAVYVFMRSSGNWSHQSYLKAPNNSNGDGFGYSVAIDGDMAIVGSTGEDSTTTYIITGSNLSTTNDDGSGNGAAYVFTRSGSNWSHYAYLKAPNNSNGDGFGYSVAVSGDTVVVGASGEDSTTSAIINSADLSSTNNSGDRNGAAYVFILP